MSEKIIRLIEDELEKMEHVRLIAIKRLIL
jgi:hypothetical protein